MRNAVNAQGLWQPGGDTCPERGWSGCDAQSVTAGESLIENIDYGMQSRTVYPFG